ncbi:Major Facilitator Superfamily protein [Trichomonas vaginalis G3]|uniref:Major Facilitator Superfamily protein n=1 Tax=Trichomonas vaginalis (strain ATCC PRA-98 / G3) TaxID=412133 RepID=A2FAB7_TRIV3|nr:major facilitator superfamily transporter [Trichomonas vaginalis G3]EAX98134.1 Major Facilitator Superfamily protein [Trichomonas vaginalis G3]KAI5484850.1 sucrose transmembrane transporter protein [Trichomonas vaginalis G3]|eukprot:XP_001311064.1 major facilitator superfamily transporter [Trichomonas vaginalis G3]
MNEEPTYRSFSDFELYSPDQIVKIPLSGRSSISIWRIIAISFSVISFQIAYSVEYAICGSMMKSLNLSNLYITLIYSTGPIAGLFVQPIIAHYSDILRSKFGRRRPFIIAGGVFIIIGFAVLYYISDKLDNLTKSQRTSRIVTLGVTLLVINIAINMVQSPARAIIGDLVPKTQQVLANTIAAMMISFAGFIGNMTGIALLANIKTLNMHQITIITGSILIILGIVLTCIFGTEESLNEIPARVSPFKEMYFAIKTMPSPISQFAFVYGFAWMAYFPFQILIPDFFENDIFNGKNIQGNDFGMLVLAVSNAFGLLYLLFQPKIIEKFHSKYVFFVSQVIAMISLIVGCFLTNKYGLMFTYMPLGISLAVCNSIPFAVIAVTVPQEQMAVYMSVINIFVVIGQQLSQLIVCVGIMKLTNNTAYTIGTASIFAFVSACLCFRIDSSLSLTTYSEFDSRDVMNDPIK